MFAVVVMHITPSFVLFLDLTTDECLLKYLYVFISKTMKETEILVLNTRFFAFITETAVDISTIEDCDSKLVSSYSSTTTFIFIFSNMFRRFRMEVGFLYARL